jgi:hypothetical protein
MSARSCRASTPNGYRFDVPLGGRITGVKRGFESRPPARNAVASARNQQTYGLRRLIWILRVG